MKHLIRLTDLTATDFQQIFRLVDELADGNCCGSLDGQTIVVFFPPTSVLTRTAFERAVYLLGGQTVLFPSDTLDRKGFIGDTAGYLSNWASAVVARHRDIALLEKLAAHSAVPIINAMSSSNHPCEILSDIYALSKLRSDYLRLNYLFVGTSGNIGNAWREAAQALGFSLTHSCPNGYEMDGVNVEQDIHKAVAAADIVLTDSLPADAVTAFAPYRITADLMRAARQGALLNPCPMFYRGEEVSADAIDSEFFVGYEFKKRLVDVQQAILLFCIGTGGKLE